MKKLYTVAVLGATGAVGQEMIKVLQERIFPVGKLIPLASARSAGKTYQVDFDPEADPQFHEEIFHEYNIEVNVL